VDRNVLSGESAGGNIALLLNHRIALEGFLPRPLAIFTCCAPIDMAAGLGPAEAFGWSLSGEFTIAELEANIADHDPSHAMTVCCEQCHDPAEVLCEQWQDPDFTHSRRAVISIFAGFYYWAPKIQGKMYNARLTAVRHVQVPRAARATLVCRRAFGSSRRDARGARSQRQGMVDFASVGLGDFPSSYLLFPWRCRQGGTDGGAHAAVDRRIREGGGPDRTVHHARQGSCGR
jgi:hypothetical protein